MQDNSIEIMGKSHISWENPIENMGKSMVSGFDFPMKSQPIDKGVHVPNFDALRGLLKSRLKSQAMTKDESAESDEDRICSWHRWHHGLNFQMMRI